MEEQDEQARRHSADRLNRDVENACPRRVACGERPAPVQDVAVQGSDREAEEGRENVRRRDREQHPVGDEAQERVADTDYEKARELAVDRRSPIGGLGEITAVLAAVQRFFQVLLSQERKPIDQAYQDEEMFI